MRKAGIIEQSFSELDLQRIDCGWTQYRGDGLVGAVRCRRRSGRLRLRRRKLQANQHKGADRNCSPPTYAANNSGLSKSGQLPPGHYAQHIAQYVVRREIFGPSQEFLIEAEQFRWNRRRLRTQACDTRVAIPTFNPLEKIERPTA
jgi:hypothetical protein